MPRIRYLKPEFFKDEDVALLPFEVRLFYQGLWVLADKDGRLEDRPQRLKVEIFPYDKVDVEKCLDLLSRSKNGSLKPFIQRYEIDGLKYIQILKWLDHQRPHHTEQDSRIPEPPAVIKGMEKGMGMGKQLEASSRSNNRSLTVVDNKPLKTKHLEFVLLAEDEFSKLVAKYGQGRVDGMIERLNNYIGSKGAKYKSHYHTLLNWFAKEGDNALPQSNYSPLIQKYLKPEGKR